MTFWGRYRKEQSFVPYPAKRRDVYKSRMEDKYYASIQRPNVSIIAPAEEQAEAVAETTKATGKGFWNTLLGAFAGKKETTVVQQAPKWPAKK